MDNYDMNALYLYFDGWNYRVGKIQKVNDKSVKMEYGIKLSKEEFQRSHKLTEEEIEIYNKELIKKLSTSTSLIKGMLASIRQLATALESSELVCIDTKKVKEKLEILNNVLGNELLQFEIGYKQFKFEDYTQKLVEIKGD